MFYVVRKQRLMGDPSKSNTKSTNKSISHGFHIASGRVAVDPMVRISSSLRSSLNTNTDSVCAQYQKNAKKSFAGPETSVVHSSQYEKNFSSIIPPVPIPVHDVHPINLSAANSSSDGLILISTNRINSTTSSYSTCPARMDKDEKKFGIYSEKYENIENTDTNYTKQATVMEEHTRHNSNRHRVNNSSSHCDDLQSSSTSPVSSTKAALSSTTTATSPLSINSSISSNHVVTTPSCTDSRSSSGVERVESCQIKIDSSILSKNKQNDLNDDKLDVESCLESDGISDANSKPTVDNNLRAITNNYQQSDSNTKINDDNNHSRTMTTTATSISSKYDTVLPCNDSGSDENKNAPLENQKSQIDQLLPTSDKDKVVSLKSEDDCKKVESTSSQTTTSSSSTTVTTGRWTQDEHEAFLAGLKIYGREWKKVSTKIPTRTSAQIRSHAQKYFAKLAKTSQNNTSLDNNHHVPYMMTSLSQQQLHQNLSPSVRQTVEKILANPDSVKQEVEETLARLYVRYQMLQQQYANNPNKPSTSTTNISDTNVNSTVPLLRPTNNNHTNQSKNVSDSSLSQHNLSKFSPHTVPQTSIQNTNTTIILKPQPTLVQSDYHMNNNCVSTHNQNHHPYTTVISNTNNNMTNVTNLTKQVAPAQNSTWISQINSTKIKHNENVNTPSSNSTSINHTTGQSTIIQNNSNTAITHHKTSNHPTNIISNQKSSTSHLSTPPKDLTTPTIIPPTSQLPSSQTSHQITQSDVAPSKELIALEVLRNGLRHSPTQSNLIPSPGSAPPPINIGTNSTAHLNVQSAQYSLRSNSSPSTSPTFIHANPSNYTIAVVPPQTNEPTNNTIVSGSSSFKQISSNTMNHNHLQHQQQQHHLIMNIVRSPTLTFQNTNITNNTNNNSAAVSGTSSPSIISSVDTAVHNFDERTRHRESSESHGANLPSKKRKTF